MRDKKDESGVGLAHLKDGLVDLLAGTAGGIANVYSGQPLDTIKVKMQTFPKLYINWVACLRHTFRTEGIRGLYAGTVPALVANISENAILFASYGFCQKAVANLFGYKSTMEMSPLENATAGSLAAFFAALALCPTELVKCKLQAQAEVDSAAKKCHLSPSTPSSICREMYRSGGVRSFYTGFTPTIIREMPGYFCFFGAYEFTRKLLTPEGKRKEEIGLLRTAVSGGIAGMTLWAVIFPADVVKSRMQVGQSGRFSAIFMKILRTEGISALYKGLTPTLIRTCVATASLFIAVENTKHFLNNL